MLIGPPSKDNFDHELLKCCQKVQVLWDILRLLRRLETTTKSTFATTVQVVHHRPATICLSGRHLTVPGLDLNKTHIQVNASGHTLTSVSPICLELLPLRPSR